MGEREELRKFTNSLRIADLSDLNNLYDLINKSYRGEFSFKGWTTEADLLGGLRVTQEYLKNAILDKNSWFFIYIPWPSEIKDQNEIVGCLRLIKESEEDLFVRLLTVNPLLQNKGIGKIILEEAELFVKEKGFKKLRMTVFTSKNELISWYERRGYHKTGKKIPYKNPIEYGIPKKDFLEFFEMQKFLI